MKEYKYDFINTISLVIPSISGLRDAISEGTVPSQGRNSFELLLKVTGSMPAGSTAVITLENKDNITFKTLKTMTLPVIENETVLLPFLIDSDDLRMIKVSTYTTVEFKPMGLTEYTIDCLFVQGRLIEDKKSLNTRFLISDVDDMATNGMKVNGSVHRIEYVKCQTGGSYMVAANKGDTLKLEAFKTGEKILGNFYQILNSSSANLTGSEFLLVTEG